MRFNTWNFEVVDRAAANRPVDQHDGKGDENPGGNNSEAPTDGESSETVEPVRPGVVSPSECPGKRTRDRIVTVAAILRQASQPVKINLMTEDLGLRERKKRERYRCIEDAAIDLFEQRGFDGTTIDDIAAAADIAPRTFFYYFPTKEDVVLADYTARLDRITTELTRRPGSESPWAALQASFVVAAEDYEARRDDLVRRFTIMAGNPTVFARSLHLQAGWEDALTEVLNQRAGRSAENLESSLLASAALACMRSSLRHWLLTGHETALPSLIQACFAQLADGLVHSGDR